MSVRNLIERLTILPLTMAFWMGGWLDPSFHLGITCGIMRLVCWKQVDRTSVDSEKISMGKIKAVVRWHAPNAVFVMLSLCPFLCAAEPSADELRIGIIGLDTPHSANFTKIINGPEATDEFAMCRVVAAYPRGSRDITASLESVPQITQQVQGLGVEIVPSIDALLKRIDCVLLESNDGRVHLEQALPVLRMRKPVFIDKPIAGSLADTVAIFEAADESKRRGGASIQLELVLSEARRQAKERLEALDVPR
jgi:hypothetical protein